jgi:hypothetical protein
VECYIFNNGWRIFLHHMIALNILFFRAPTLCRPPLCLCLCRARAAICPVRTPTRPPHTHPFLRRTKGCPPLHLGILPPSVLLYLGAASWGAISQPTRRVWSIGIWTSSRHGVSQQRTWKKRPRNPARLRVGGQQAALLPGLLGRTRGEHTAVYYLYCVRYVMQKGVRAYTYAYAPWMAG